MFKEGIITGLMIAVSMMVADYIVASRRGYPKEPLPGFRKVGQFLIISLPCLLLICIIFCFVRSVIFTSTYSSFISFFYALLFTILVYLQIICINFFHAKIACRVETSNARLHVFLASMFGGSSRDETREPFD